MWNYTDKVMDHFLHPRNVGEIADADAVGEVGNIVCGDAMKLYIKLSADSRTVERATFQTFGCTTAIASASALTEMLQGVSLADAALLTNQDIADYLGELPKEKMHCSVMGMEAFQSALADLRRRRPDLALPESTVPETGVERVVCHCFGVTEGKLREVIRSNSLTTLEEVTHYCKAGGGCGECKGEINEILQQMLNERRGCEAPVPAAAGGVMTNLQKIKLIQTVFDEIIRPGLHGDGGDAELVDIDGDQVYVRLQGRCVACPSAVQTLKHWVEAKLREKVSQAISVLPVK